MSFLRVVVALAVVMLAACSGGEEPTGTFAVPTNSRPSAAPRSVTTVAPGKLRPPAPARLFAGTRSAAGQLTHYCKDTTCTDQGPRLPAFVPAPSGSLVLFTLGDEPVEATAEITTTAGQRAGSVRLSPASLMVFDHGLGPGRWLVDLIVRWRASEARWRFGLTVS